MLSVQSLRSGYGALEILHGVDLEVPDGEIRTVIGGNGRGKSTLLKTIAGVLRPWSGTINWNGEYIQGRPSHEVVGKGISLVVQGHQLFPSLTIAENLEMGGFLLESNQKLIDHLDYTYQLFPWIKGREKQKAATLSGGEQQMVSIARALMIEPQLLLLDEPSLGLAPSVLHEVFNVIRSLRERGVSILLVEQVVGMALDIADWAYVIDSGIIVESCKPKDLEDGERLRSVFFGDDTLERDEER